MPSVCLSVCLLATVVKTTERIFTRKFYHRCICTQGRTDYILEVIRFRIRIQEFLKGFFNIARYGIFSQFAHISGETDRIFMKFYHKCNFEQGSPIKFWKSSGSGS